MTDRVRENSVASRTPHCRNITKMRLENEGVESEHSLPRIIIAYDRIPIWHAWGALYLRDAVIT
jgi:hypothetical protein